MIRVQNLAARTPLGKSILSSINLQISPGQTLGVYGPNGSGKSTLLRAIAGVARGRKISGEITVNGLQVNDELAPYLRVKKVVYLGSDFHTPFQLRVSELFELGAEVMNRSHGEIHEVVERLALRDFLIRDFKTLSDGEKQMVMFARALIQKPEALIFDESFSKLDLDKLLLVAKTIRNYAAQGTTFIVASHDLNFLTETADDFLFLKKGNILAQGHVSNVLNLQTLEALYPEVSVHVVVSPETGRYKLLY